MANPSPLFPKGAKKLPLSAIKAREERRAIESRLRILVKAVEQSPVSIIVTDNEGIIKYVNPKFCKVTGYTIEEVLGKTPRILKGGFLSADFYRDLWQTILAGEEWHGIFHNRTKSGEFVWELASISPIRDEDGLITHFVSVKEDFTEIKRLQDRMDNLAHHDQLTGLPNRTLFYDRLRQAQAMARRRDEGFALFYMDLDGFKAVNDGHGHELGDQLLKAVGERISGCVRESDTVARMGGDEFTVLLPELQSRETAGELARLIIDALTQPFSLGEVTCHIGVSIGISFYPKDSEEPERLISYADAAMYRVKNAGKNGFVFWA
ncbi:MAG: diguanylate cyclase [Holophaga sp.]|nr:diguanylate cyclase [Holophaga sp.]